MGEPQSFSASGSWARAGGEEPRAQVAGLRLPWSLQPGVPSFVGDELLSWPNKGSSGLGPFVRKVKGDANLPEMTGNFGQLAQFLTCSKINLICYKTISLVWLKCVLLLRQLVFIWGNLRNHFSRSYPISSVLL